MKMKVKLKGLPAYIQNKKDWNRVMYEDESEAERLTGLYPE